MALVSAVSSLHRDRFAVSPFNPEPVGDGCRREQLDSLRPSPTGRG